MSDYNVDIKPLDIVLSRPTGWIGRAISWFTASEFSHTGIIVKNVGRTWVVDADPPVVRIMPLSSWLQIYPSVAVMRLGEYMAAPPNWRKVNRDAINFLAPMIGIREYSERTIARLAARIPLGALPATAPIDYDEPVICSRLVSETLYAVAGVDPVEDRADWASTPGDLFESEKLHCFSDKLEVE